MPIVKFQSITDHLTDIITACDEEGARRIKYIALSRGEWDEFSQENDLFARNMDYVDSGIMGKYLGVNLVGLCYHKDQLMKGVKLNASI